MAPAALKKMRARGGKTADLKQRFGRFDGATRELIGRLQAQGELWWMHAVSVGEIGVAGILIRELLARRSDLRIVLSTTTPTGRAQAEKIAAGSNGRVVVIYNPLDLWFTVRRCLNIIRPSRLVLVESEVWPNLVYAARARSIPVWLVNARLSPRSERRYGYVRPLVRPIFSMLDGAIVPEQDDVARWERLGINRSRIAAAGNIKYDTAGQEVPVKQIECFASLLGKLAWSDAPVLLAASTHPGEEGVIASVYRELRNSVHGVKFIAVPRHAERAAEVEAELRELGLKTVRRSKLDGITDADADVLIVDTTGELRAWQHLATVVVVGKSFSGKGGQNPAEAVTAGKPVLFGPHMENFDSLVRQMLAAHGALQVADYAVLSVRLRELFASDTMRSEMAAAGMKALKVHEGSTGRAVDILLSAH